MSYASCRAPRIELALLGCRRLTPRGGYPPMGVPALLGALVDTGLVMRGMSPATNRGNLRSSSQNTSVARSRNRGGPREDNFCRAWFRLGWKLSSGSRYAGGPTLGGALGGLRLKACLRNNSSKTSVLSSRNWTEVRRCSLSRALFAGGFGLPSRDVWER